MDRLLDVLRSGPIELSTVARHEGMRPKLVTSAMTRAGLVADRVSLYRHDLFVNRDQFKDPHSLVIRTDTPVMHDLSVLAQEQISGFCASDGATTIDPDSTGVLFEVPPAIVPQDFGFIP